MSSLDEALDYFRSEAFHGLFTAFRNKYKSLGRIGGSVSVNQLTSKELVSVSGFMGMMPEELKQKKRLSLAAFEKQISLTRFEDLCLLDILEGYFGEELISKLELAERKQAHLESLFSKMEKAHSSISFWLAQLKKKDPSTYLFYAWLEEDEESFLRLIATLATAFEQRPSSFERLPMFSQRITKNPHSFDSNQRLGKLWIHLLSVHSGLEAIPKASEQITALFYQYKILKDDLLNFTTCANLLADTKEGVHPVWREAHRLHLVRNIPIRELLTINKVYVPKGNTVYLVENSGVCSVLLDLVPDIPVIATQGQIKLATWMLLDLLVKDNLRICYAGDLDPEGLQMAELVKKRYPDHVVFWRMTESDYYGASPEVELKPERIRKLDSIKDPVLVKVANVMKQTGKAGYQEALVEKMLEDLKK